MAVSISLAVCVWVAFGQATRHEFVNFDDATYVYENDMVARGLSGAGVAWAFTHTQGNNWHPLTTVSHMLDCQLFGLNPASHRLVNVLLHGATTVLLLLLLWNLTGALWQSACVAALFGLHPLHVESVAWIAERKDVLSGLFFILMLWTYARYAKAAAGGEGKLGAGHAPRSPPAASRYYLLSLCFFALGLMSKPMLVTAPFVLLLLDLWPLARWQAQPGQSAGGVKRLLVEKIPFLLLSALACAITLMVQRNVIQSSQHWHFPVRAGNALVSYFAYVRQTIYPAELAVLYPHPGNVPAGAVAASALALSIISAAVLVAWRKRPYLLVGWLWFVGMLVPVIGLVQVGTQARADRYTYLPQIGLSIAAVWGAANLSGLWRHGQMALRLAGPTMVVALTVAARLQTSHWRDSISLWTHTLACTSNNPVAHLKPGPRL
jgi:hypothetical protein